MENPRSTAYKILFKILYADAYSNIEINKTFRKAELDDRDRGFVTEIVYGTLEKKLYLEYVAKKFSKTPIKKLSKEVRLILLMALYQIRFMDSVTDFAAVDESVKLCKKVFPKGSGFVNGVLRNVLRDEKAFDIPTKRTIENRSVRYSVSEDIIRLLEEQYGHDETERILDAVNEKPRLFLRVNSLKTNTQDLIDILSRENVSVDRVKGEEFALEVKGLKNIEKDIAYLDGLFTVQDTSSMKTVRALDPKPGERLLDLCACPGGKSTFMAELMHNEGYVLAQDISVPKLKLVDKACSRLGIGIVETRMWDATITDPDMIGSFDRVLIDAPCSGLGIIRKKPEIRYRLCEQFESLYDIQKKILNNGAKYLKDGGILVYSTCTINKKENEDRIRDLMRDNNFLLLEERCLLFGEEESDGFYIAKLKKTEKA